MPVTKHQTILHQLFDLPKILGSVLNILKLPPPLDQYNKKAEKIKLKNHDDLYRNLVQHFLMLGQ
jgi:hypothetical protein